MLMFIFGMVASVIMAVLLWGLLASDKNTPAERVIGGVMFGTVLGYAITSAVKFL